MTERDVIRRCYARDPEVVERIEKAIAEEIVNGGVRPRRIEAHRIAAIGAESMLGYIERHFVLIPKEAAGDG